MSGIASLALAVWVVFFPPADIYGSRTLLWVATIACMLVASYRIWAKERDEREKLYSELARPRFKLSGTRMYRYKDSNNLCCFEYVYENVGSRSADNLTSRVVFLDTNLREAPTVLLDTSVANELEVNEPHTSRAEAYLLKDEPPHFVCLAMKYEDAVTRKTYRQISFMRWNGIKNGFVTAELYHCTVDERQRLTEHLQEPLKDFLPDAPSPLPKRRLNP